MLGTATTTLVAFAITLSLPVAAAVGGVEFVVKSAYDVVMGWRAETRRREEARRSGLAGWDGPNI